MQPPTRGYIDTIDLAKVNQSISLYLPTNLNDSTNRPDPMDSKPSGGVDISKKPVPTFLTNHSNKLDFHQIIAKRIGVAHVAILG